MLIVYLNERGISMKKSDMKIIAIVLSIGLFFSVVTSNAVSIASVVLLMGKSDTVASENIDTNSDVNQSENANQSANNSSNQTSSNVNTNTNSNSNQSAGNTSTSTPVGNTSADANKPSVDNSSNSASNNNSSDKPADNNASQSTGTIDKEALQMFQKAAKDINENAVAGYSKKNWQTVAQDLHLDQLESLSGRLSDMIESFMTSEADAEVKVSEKGSDDAKNRMPACNCTEATIASVTKKDAGDNVIITIVMKDSLNPTLKDTDGVTVMTDDLLYIEYVTDTIESNGFVNALVKELTKGDINYVAFTITATMTKDGKFVEIRHDGDGFIDAAAQTILGEVSGTGGIGFHAHFYDFKY